MQPAPAQTTIPPGTFLDHLDRIDRSEASLEAQHHNDLMLICQTLQRNPHGSKEELIARIRQELFKARRNLDTPPICLAPVKDVIPHRYVLHVRCCHCRNCGTVKEYSELYVETHLRSRTGAGKYVTNLRPCDTPTHRLPVTIIPTEKRTIAFCVECAWDFERDAMQALPLPPIPTPEAVLGGPSQPAKPDRPGKEKIPNVSAADLMDLL